MKEELIKKAYEVAKERYAAIGVDTDKAIERLVFRQRATILVVHVTLMRFARTLSLLRHCWQVIIV